MWIPQQQRTRASLERMLDATEELLALRGFEDISIAEIAKASASSVGGFYRRFRDKDGLVQALHERFCAEAKATAERALDVERWHSRPLPDVLAAVVRLLVTIHRARHGLMRVFLHRAMRDPLVAERNAALFAHLDGVLRALLLDHASEIARPDPADAATFGLHVVVGALNEATMVRTVSSDANADGRFQEELTRMLASYLGAGSVLGDLRR
jgi:AcrR family transcriptional regulator